MAHFPPDFLAALIQSVSNEFLTTIIHTTLQLIQELYSVGHCGTSGCDVFWPYRDVVVHVIVVLEQGETVIIGSRYR